MTTVKHEEFDYSAWLVRLFVVFAVLGLLHHVVRMEYSALDAMGAKLVGLVR